MPVKAVETSAKEDIVFAAISQKCSFCGNKRHPRRICPAREIECYRCGKKGHFAKVCRSSGSTQQDTCATLLHLTPNGNYSSCSLQNSNDKVNVVIKVNGVSAKALIDTGSTLSHISDSFHERLNSQLQESKQFIGLAVKGCASPSLGMCKTCIELNDKKYEEVTLTVLKDLLTDVILGQDFMQLHQSVKIHFGGAEPTLTLGILQPIKTSAPVKLFEHLQNNCVPVATKERRYSCMTKSSYPLKLRDC